MKAKKLICVILIFSTIFTFVPFIPTAVVAAAGDKFMVRIMATDLAYDEIREFNEGLALVKLNKKWGYINITGKLIAPIEYDEAYTFSDNLAVVCKYINGNQKYGYINKTGKIVVPIKYDYAYSFNDGFAVVGTAGYKYSDGFKLHVSKYGIIDKTGKIILPIEYDTINNYSETSIFHEGLATVSKRTDEGDKWGYIDKTGKIVIPLEYHLAFPFYNGLAAVNTEKGWGVIDTKGNVVLPFGVLPAIYMFIGQFRDGLAFACRGFTFDPVNEQYYHEDKYGYIDITGKIVIPCEYDYAGDFNNGLAIVEKKGKCGVIDKAGNVVVPLEYYYITPFSDGLSVVWKDGTCKVIDESGKIFAPLKDYIWFDTFDKGMILAQNMNKYCIVNKTGEVIIEFECKSARFKNGVVVVNNGPRKWDIIQILTVGDPIGDVLYSDITAYINGHAIPTSVINGKTLVVAEDLRKYGFDVKWDGVERTLKVEINKNKPFAPLQVTKDTTYKPGTFKCKYLFTDIKTYLSGEVVESYAINGVTLIDFELLKKYGKLTWDGKAREIRLTIG